MRRAVHVSALIFLGSLAAAVASPTHAAPRPFPAKPSRTATAPVPAHGFRFDAGRFGPVTVYEPDGAPRSVALFFSGDGGWELGVVDMAEALRRQGALVAGISVPTYFNALNASKASCESVGADLERLSQVVQSRAGVRTYHYPILVGYSSGATLVYAALNQTPKGIFAGGVSLGFCPDLELAKPLCKGENLQQTRSTRHVGVDLARVERVPAPWIVLHGTVDQVCEPAATQRFIAGIDDAGLVSLPGVGHGFSVPAHWESQFEDAYLRLAEHAPQNHVAAPAPALGDLPVVEVPATGGLADEFVILITGDGGYAGIDQDLAAGFAGQGRPTVVLNSLRYFWTERTPQQVAADLDRIMRHYLEKWRKSRVVLVGYSQGADVLPFALNRLPEETLGSVAAAAFIGVSHTATFEFNFSNWLSTPHGLPTAPELDRLHGPRLTCLYGAQEPDTACTGLPRDRFRIVKLPGGHHFNGDYAAVVAAVLAQVTG